MSPVAPPVFSNALTFVLLQSYVPKYAQPLDGLTTTHNEMAS